MNIGETSNQPKPRISRPLVGTNASSALFKKTHEDKAPNDGDEAVDVFVKSSNLSGNSKDICSEAQLRLQKELSDAVKKDNVLKIRELVNLGVDVNGLEPSTGHLFLASSIRRGCSQNVYKELILQGASLIAESKKVGTALHMAVSTCNFDAAYVLVLAGSDPHHGRNSDGLTALDLVAFQDPEFAEYCSSEMESCRRLWVGRQT